MMIVPFRAEHIERMSRADTPAMRYLRASDARCLENGLAFTALEGDTVIMCAGAHEIWPGRYLAWAHISPDACHFWKSIHKATKGFLRDLNARRIEAEVDADFEAGRRWAERLGFKCEVDRRAGFFPDGRDASLYALVRNDG